MPRLSLERSVARTLILSIAGVMLVAAALAVMLLKQTIERRMDARIAASAAELQSSVSRSAGGGLVLEDASVDPVFEERGSGWGWVVRDRERVLARSRSLAGGDLPATVTGVLQVVSAPAGEIRILTVAVRSTPDLVLTIAAPQSAIWRELTADARIVVGAILLLGAVLIVVAAWQARRALAPARALAHDLQQIRAGRIERLPDSRIEEVAAVTGVINDLLAERRQTALDAIDSAGKLAHGLKTPLAVLAARSDAGGSAPDPKVMESVGLMQRLVTANLAAMRATRRSRVGGQGVRIRPILDDLTAAFRHKFFDKSLDVDVDVAADLVVGMPEDEFLEAVGNVIENAFRHARSRIVLRLDPHASDAMKLMVLDDGPGFGTACPAPDGAGEVDHGNGLGLAITRDLLERHGGSLTIGRGEGSGAIVTLTLPRGEQA